MVSTFWFTLKCLAYYRISRWWWKYLLFWYYIHLNQFRKENPLHNLVANFCMRIGYLHKCCVARFITRFSTSLCRIFPIQIQTIKAISPQIGNWIIDEDLAVLWSFHLKQSCQISISTLPSITENGFAYIIQPDTAHRKGNIAAVIGFRYTR